MEDSEFEKLWKIVDEDGNGTFDFTEFCLAFSHGMIGDDQHGVSDDIFKTNTTELADYKGHAKRKGQGDSVETSRPADIVELRTLTAIEAELTPKITAVWRHLREAFVSFDHKRTGSILREDFTDTLERFFVVLTEPELKIIFTSLNLQDGDKIKYQGVNLSIA